MPVPRPPSRIDPLTFPVFGMCWYGDPANGRSISAYTGGGGSARTGVFNSIVIVDGDKEEVKIDTGEAAGFCVHIYKNPVTNKIYMLVALGWNVQRYSMPNGELAGVLNVDPESSKDMCNAVAVNAMTDKLAVGLESGLIKVYSMSDDLFSQDAPLLAVCEGHQKAVCALCFSMHGGRLLSSAKDGCARVWNSDYECIAEMECDCVDPTAPPPKKKRPPQVLVRGCAFIDLEGKVAITVASERRGKAFLFQWAEQKPGQGYQCATRTEVSPCPVSAMSMSQDAHLLAMGSVDGSITLFNIPDWKPMQKFKEVHDLPVTCIAARPTPVPLQGEDGVTFHAVSASADSKLAFLTMQRKVPKSAYGGGSGGGGTMVFLHRLLWTAVIFWILSPIAKEVNEKCVPKFKSGGLEPFGVCVKEEVIIAPPDRVGISTPPY